MPTGSCVPKHMLNPYYVKGSIYVLPYLDGVAPYKPVHPGSLRAELSTILGSRVKVTFRKKIYLSEQATRTLIKS